MSYAIVVDVYAIARHEKTMDTTATIDGSAMAMRIALCKINAGIASATISATLPSVSTMNGSMGSPGCSF
jgi:hypothetical protein